MKKAIKILIKILAFAILTILTQIGGIAFMISELVAKKINRANKLKRILIFIGTYLLLTFLIVPLIAPLLGREKVIHTEKIN
ncbi:MAG: putative membrane protein, partial [Saprospiraceae bacterium]